MTCDIKRQNDRNNDRKNDRKDTLLLLLKIKNVSMISKILLTI